MSLIVLDVELAEENVVKTLGVYIDGQVFGYSFKPPKNYQSTHQTLWCLIPKKFLPKTCTKLIGKVTHWIIALSTPCWLNCDNTEPSTLHKDWKSVNFSAHYWVRKWKTWMTMVAPRFNI